MKKKAANRKNALKTEWDFGLLYKGKTNITLERDVQIFERAAEAFEKKYRPRIEDFSNEELLASALVEYEKLSTMPEASRPGYFLGLRRERDASDSDAEKKLNLLSERLTKAANKLLFFDLALGKLPQEIKRALLESEALKEFRYHLYLIFENARHDLSEPEERILNLKSNTSHSLWVSGTEKILNKRSVRHGKKMIPIAEAFELVAKLPKAARRRLWNECMKVCKSLGEIAENELNAVVLDKKVNDELRSFEKPYSATILGYENSEASIEELVRTVTKAFPIAHRFYALKAKYMGEKKLKYADRAASIGKDPKVSFEESVRVLEKTFGSVSVEYKNILTNMLSHGQIDVFPKKGKTGGAFCASTEHLPTFVLLNFVPGMRSLMTFAHEMGHAVHAERAKTMRPLYQGHSTSTAETASTLFENLVFEAEIADLTKKERAIALHNKIQDDISTIMRQVAFFNFERDMHETIRRQGGMTHTELSRLMQKHLQSYLGPSVDVSEDDGYSFVYISHFRNFFYVYTYAYGNVVSNTIIERFKKDPSYKKAIDAFMTAGSSASPDDIFASIGINTTDPTFFKEGLERLSKRIDEFESLVS